MTIDERLDKIEKSIALLTERLDRIDPGGQPASDVSGPGHPPPQPSGRGIPDPATAHVSAGSALASKSTEWWLARGGAILTLLALILLYQYAVAHNWITPLVRVFAGILLGIVLFVAGQRTSRRADGGDIGMREVLLGASISAWYITAYAASIFYSLISLSTARFAFLALTVFGAWLALRETRSILANLALAAGFATPILLPSDNPSIPAFSIYLATLTAIGLLLYLMRGWQLVLWLTFFAFWISAGSAAGIACCADIDTTRHITGSVTAARVSLSILIALGALSLMRVPALRRGLLATESDLYTQPRRSEYVAAFQGEIARVVSRLTGRPAEDDSAALWTFILWSPLVALLLLSWTLNRAPMWEWGIVALIAAFFAWQAVASSREMDSELRHVLAAAVTLWSLIGVSVTAWDAAPWPISRESATLLVMSIHALVTLEATHASRYAVPRRIALTTSLLSLGTVLFSELLNTNLRSPFDGQWLIAELGGVALAIWIWWNRKEFNLHRFASVMGVGAYIALLAIDARVLGLVWQPLVTASYAIAGAALLIAARSRADGHAMRRLGSFSLVIVVARLLLVDLARVETIWGVLLFLGCGALFLVTSYRLQSSGREQSA